MPRPRQLNYRNRRIKAAILDHMRQPAGTHPHWYSVANLRRNLNWTPRPSASVLKTIMKHLLYEQTVVGMIGSYNSVHFCLKERWDNSNYSRPPSPTSWRARDRAQRFNRTVRQALMDGNRQPDPYGNESPNNSREGQHPGDSGRNSVELPSGPIPEEPLRIIQQLIRFHAADRRINTGLARALENWPASSSDNLLRVLGQDAQWLTSDDFREISDMIVNEFRTRSQRRQQNRPQSLEEEYYQRTET